MRGFASENAPLEAQNPLWRCIFATRILKIFSLRRAGFSLAAPNTALVVLYLVFVWYFGPRCKTSHEGDHHE